MKPIIHTKHMGLISHWFPTPILQFLKVLEVIMEVLSSKGVCTNGAKNQFDSTKCLTLR